MIESDDSDCHLLDWAALDISLERPLTSDDDPATDEPRRVTDDDPVTATFDLTTLLAVSAK